MINKQEDIKKENFIDLYIRSREKDELITISPYECGYGFRRSRFLYQLLTMPDQKDGQKKSFISIFEDSENHNIKAALDYMHNVLL